MPSCADALAATLREAGVTRLFGLPGGEILDFIDAARRAGLEFILTRDEATAAFMADVTGQLTGIPGVCVSTLGPGAVNMTLGVANAYLDRSPVVAITAAHSTAAAPLATHQNLDLNAVYRPFTKSALTLDGRNTALKVRAAINVSLQPRMGPVHIALPSNIARVDDQVDVTMTTRVDGSPGQTDALESTDGFAAVSAEIAAATRPVVILGLDLDPRRDVDAVRAFVDAFGAPVFVTPKAKGILPENHPLFCGVCAGVSGDSVVLDFFRRADLLVGIGFEPVESDKLWHHTMKLVAVGPVSIAADSYRPHAEAVGDVRQLLPALQASARPTVERLSWTAEDRARFRQDLDRCLQPETVTRGLSGYLLTRRLRELFPRDTIFTTDVGSVKMITSQAWTTYEPLTFFESNGLSSMRYSLPAAMAARLLHRDRPILCTVGDGGFGMTIADLETCVRENLAFVVVVFNDSSLSLIDASQQRRGHPTLGVRYGPVDFAAAAAGFGAWSRRVETLEALDTAVIDAQRAGRVAVIDATVDPREYLKQTS
jgi:acetolactate synthase I/II/III large subunit